MLNKRGLVAEPRRSRHRGHDSVTCPAHRRLPHRSAGSRRSRCGQTLESGHFHDRQYAVPAAQRFDDVSLGLLGSLTRFSATTARLE